MKTAIAQKRTMQLMVIRIEKESPQAELVEILYF